MSQAIGFQRLVRLMAEVFGVTISEGAIANILARAGAAGCCRSAAGAGGAHKPGGRLRRNLRARRRQDVVAVGAAVLHGNLSCYCRYPRGRGGDRFS
jgi:hypothetical protein